MIDGKFKPWYMIIR